MSYEEWLTRQVERMRGLPRLSTTQERQLRACEDALAYARARQQAQAWCTELRRCLGMAMERNQVAPGVVRQLETMLGGGPFA